MQSSQSYQMIGLMSGTSGDGLDIAYTTFDFDGQWSFAIPHAETIPFPKKLGKQLRQCHELSGLDLALLDVSFGKWMGEQVKEFCKKYNIQPQAIASHGHTVFHQPQKGLSLQIGNAWSLHVACGLPVINDFRMLDIQLGGQGAPLVPIGDQLLFGEFDYCINLGGIANISMDQAGHRVAFDICPFNLLLNHFAQKKKMPYDANGALAKSGKLIPKLLKALNKHRFYKKSGAKSLGREDLASFFECIDSGEKVSNILHTLVEHYAIQIAACIEAKEERKASVILTGGGAFNRYFVERLEAMLLEKAQILPIGEQVIQFKEALIFAFLGVLRLRNEINTLASVTGANRDSCGGVLIS
ncbi:anhydro-N-acetylmuramic acid kinase [Mongoliitalea daihaiensis]|uniref:anhydro-N-acetylmuramic acid kinase n=1 Tax=Mongoliitalea daihaiensis TaxID=2782006 RepID=UPI001F4886CB|nr:anhydro-N-acetylmuramic acid kinase [Mongoliitalea daihaiensis]UJP66375.1 anhydro-N-acetylmuramic acid kinase [Mongoliitalea daihaiensis]